MRRLGQNHHRMGCSICCYMQDARLGVDLIKELQESFTRLLLLLMSIRAGIRACYSGKEPSWARLLYPLVHIRAKIGAGQQAGLQYQLVSAGPGCKLCQAEQPNWVEEL